MRTTAVTVALVASLAGGLLCAACSAEDDPVWRVSATSSAGTASPTATPAATPSPAVRTLRGLRDFLGSQPGVSARAVVPGSGGVVAATATADLRTGDFRGRLGLGPGRGDLELIRVGDLTWTRAPIAFWVGLGYTTSSARRASGKWVVVPVDGFRALVESLDPNKVLSRIEALPDDAARGRSVLRTGPDRGLIALRVLLEDAPVTLVVTPGPVPRLVRVRGGSPEAPLDFVVEDYPSPRIAIPAAADVLQP